MNATQEKAAEPFQFLYFSQLNGALAVHAESHEALGRVIDLNVQATTPYPSITGVHLRTGTGVTIHPWQAVKAIIDNVFYMLPDPAAPLPPADYTVRRDLLGKPAVEVSANTLVKIWDLHFVYSEDKMVLAHAETGLRGRLRAVGLEKPALLVLGSLLKNAMRERFATFRHLQVLRRLPSGEMPIPKRILEMHPADLATVLRQLPTRLRRPVFGALNEEAAAAVLMEAEESLQQRLLGDCPREKALTLRKRMKQMRDRPAF